MEHAFEIVLAIIWLGGSAIIWETVDGAGRWVGVTALLIVGVTAEMMFVRWNTGHWPGSTPSGEPKPS